MQKKVIRADWLDVPYNGSKKSDEGFLLVKAPVAKVGVYEYRLADGSVQRELVTEETLWSSESNETLKLKPVTNGHPEGLLDTTTVKAVKVGSVGETVEYDEYEELLYASFSVTDSDAIDDVEAGRIQLSPAYQCFLIEEAGEWNGVSYDFKQVGRRYNHLALVDSARGGEDLSIKLDGKNTDGGIGKLIISKQKKDGIVMDKPTIKVDGVDAEVSGDVKRHVDKLQAKIDGMNDEVGGLKKTNADSAKEIEALKATIKSHEDGTDGVVAKLVAERTSLVLNLDGVLAKDSELRAKMDSMSNAELKKNFILAVQPSANLDGKSDDYIEARHDTCIELLADRKDGDEKNVFNNSSTKSPIHVDGDEDEVEQARINMDNASLTAWKKGE